MSIQNVKNQVKAKVAQYSVKLDGPPHNMSALGRHVFFLDDTFCRFYLFYSVYKPTLDFLTGIRFKLQTFNYLFSRYLFVFISLYSNFFVCRSQPWSI